VQLSALMWRAARRRPTAAAVPQPLRMTAYYDIVGVSAASARSLAARVPPLAAQTASSCCCGSGQVRRGNWDQARDGSLMCSVVRATATHACAHALFPSRTGWW